MSLPYILCPKCQQRNSNQDYWTCPACGYSIEVREEELRKWNEEQEILCREVIKDLLPNQKIDLSFVDYLPNEWGTSSYRENDINKANQAEKRFTKSERLGYFGVNNLITYKQEASIIIISRQSLKVKALKVKEVSSPTGLAGFLPTSTHEAAHISPQVNHDPLYQPWINKGHDDVWRKVSEKFYQQAKIKFGKKVEARFKKLKEIQSIPIGKIKKSK